MTDACECGNEPSGSVKCGEFLALLRVWLQYGKKATKKKKKRKKKKNVEEDDEEVKEEEEEDVEEV